MHLSTFQFFVTNSNFKFEFEILQKKAVCIFILHIFVYSHNKSQTITVLCHDQIKNQRVFLVYTLNNIRVGVVKEKCLQASGTKVKSIVEKLKAVFKNPDLTRFNIQ